MDHRTIITKIQSFVEIELTNQVGELVDQCTSGDILSFETELWSLVLGLYNLTAESYSQEA
jgi:hypothetical protein